MSGIIPETYLFVYIALMRWAAPILVLLLLLRCFRPLLTFRKEPEIWAWLMLSDGKKIPITHWENIIGRHKKSDVVIDFPTVSRNHGVLTRYDDGSWTISDTDSSGGILVNGEKISICALEPEDVIDIGGIEMTLCSCCPCFRSCVQRDSFFPRSRSMCSLFLWASAAF